jgi:hypothetical protein
VHSAGSGQDGLIEPARDHASVDGMDDMLLRAFVHRQSLERLPPLIANLDEVRDDPAASLGVPVDLVWTGA